MPSCARARGGIIIVVAHRTTALAGVDQVLLMVDGRAQAFGPKDQILNQLRQQQPQQPRPVPLRLSPEATKVRS